MIDVNNLTFKYPGNKEPAIDRLSFNVKQGEIFGFLGPSGAGKSTTQRVLNKLLPFYEGSVSVLDKELHQWGPDFYNHIGVSFELPNHYLKLTALENLEFFSVFYQKPTKNKLALLEMVGLQDDAGKRVEAFSKGMKMRLNFIRALMHDPAVLFLDEPTSGLDPVNARRIKNIIVDLKQQGKTIFITTHNMFDADELCDRVAFIMNGKIILTDNPKTIRMSKSERKVQVEHLAGNKVLKDEFPLDTLGQDTAFLNILQHEKIAAIHSVEPTLEDVFVSLTGKHLV